MTMKRLITILTCASLGLFSSAGFAGKGLKYSYAEIGYTNIDSDIAESDGIGVNISYAALDNVHVKLGYTRLFVDEIGGLSVDVDVDRFLLGVGGNYSITDNIDLTGSLSYIDFETSGDAKDSVDGYLADIGIRALVSKKFELNATVANLHLASEDDTGFGVGAVFKFYKKFSAVANVRQFDDDDETEIFIGVRLNL